jgi:hypothetical protein
MMRKKPDLKLLLLKLMSQLIREGSLSPDQGFQKCSKFQSSDDDLYAAKFASGGEAAMAMLSTADDFEDPDELMKDFSYEHKFKEEDVLDLPVLQFGKEIHLKAYRYPPKTYRKAVVFYIHGYGSFAQANGCIAKYLADYEFEVFAID